MKKTIDPITGKRTYIEQVNDGELVIEIRTAKADPKSKADLMSMWVKRGGYGRVLDFDWMLPATPENEARIVAECLRMAAEGVTAK